MGLLLLRSHSKRYLRLAGGGVDGELDAAGPRVLGADPVLLERELHVVPSPLEELTQRSFRVLLVVVLTRLKEKMMEIEINTVLGSLIDEEQPET